MPTAAHRWLTNDGAGRCNASRRGVISVAMRRPASGDSRALRGKLLNGLITNELMAERLLNK
jgi:hypothetical protein